MLKDTKFTPLTPPNDVMLWDITHAYFGNTFIGLEELQGQRLSMKVEEKANPRAMRLANKKGKEL